MTGDMNDLETRMDVINLCVDYVIDRYNDNEYHYHQLEEYGYLYSEEEFEEQRKKQMYAMVCEYFGYEDIGKEIIDTCVDIICNNL